ncbi:hypothetical protein SAMD00019534_056390 [Acytostelium subglobosum LB1]|uniref:hypothetical protein n=1 Tax=Acytostelium subglobosum LB1 TaxID=1410327 RepID=UPI0006449246|nr:hypothetical protein SAMD00019534_056390 [Acytostelium subglobosum LB1]GAM22464.1 hypothetical protein SAMD00019534_056390 [Acytostelium subglobosum LB1]|eukprot:XP_012754584.1 hypothetical protein SAMD00019534_056390 [Acytostelium subglobosum LB1]
MKLIFCVILSLALILLSTSLHLEIVQALESEITNNAPTSYSLPLYPGKSGKPSKWQRPTHPSKVVHSLGDDRFAVRMSGEGIDIRTIIWVADQKQEVIVDSGSIMLVVPSSECQTCHQTKPYYKSSSTANYMSCKSAACIGSYINSCTTTPAHPNGTCTNQISYLDQTKINSYIVTDSFKMAENMPASQLTFGSIYTQEGGHPLMYGIMGMGNTCPRCEKSAIDAVFDHLNISRKFAMWFDESYNGMLTIGDVDKPQNDLLAYTPLLSIDVIHYGVFTSYAVMSTHVYPDKLVLNSKDLGITIIDTGSTFTLMAPDAYDKFKEYLVRNCSLPAVCGEQSLVDGYCQTLTDEEVNMYPTIKIGFVGDVEISISPATYLATTVEDGITYRCLGVVRSPLEQRTILGLSWLRIFDKELHRFGIGKKVTSTQSSFRSSRTTPAPVPSVPKPALTPYKDVFGELQCKVEVDHHRLSVIRDNGHTFSQWNITIKNTGHANITDLQMVMSDNIVTINRNYYLNRFSFSPPLSLQPNDHITMQYTAKGVEPLITLLPEYPECNFMRNNIMTSSSKSATVRTQTQAHTQAVPKTVPQTQPHSPAHVPATVIKKTPLSSTNSKVKKIDTTICQLNYSQRKGYEWRGSNGITYSFWEVDLINNSNNNITDVVLSTLDDIVFAIGMDRTVDGQASTVLTLPKSKMVPAGGDYRWLYSTRLSDSVTYSVTGIGNCH